MEIDWMNLGIFTVTTFVGFFIIALMHEKIKYDKKMNKKNET